MSNRMKRIKKKIALKRLPELQKRYEVAIQEAEFATAAAEYAVRLAENKTAKLACVLAFILADNKGEVSIAGGALATLPQDVVLHEQYDDETDVYTFRVARPKKVEVVTPEQARLEIASK